MPVAFVESLVQSSGGGPNPTDAFSIATTFPETNATESDAGTFAINGTYADTNAIPTETTQAGLSGYADTTATPTDARQVTVIYAASGTFVCPAGVTTVTVECIGGGGSGGGGQITQAASGGGGGCYAKSSLAVTPGNTYTVTVGTGGPAPAAGSTGAFGGDSWFNTSATVIAKGGLGGLVTGVSQGVQSGSVGTTVFNGGTGGSGAAAGKGGGGGSSAGTASIGNNGANGTATVSGTGGVAPAGGGNGGAAGAPPVGGSVPGGGGGGGDSAVGQTVGGAGAGGQVKLTFVL